MIAQTLLFILLLQVLIALIELLVNFKAKSVLKTIFVLLLVAIAWFVISRLFANYGLYNRLMTTMPGTLIVLGILFLLNFLYQYKVSKSMLVGGISLIIVHWSILAYYWLVLGIPNSIELSELDLFKTFLFFPRVIIILLIFSYASWLLVKIYRKFPSENQYFKRLKLWSTKFPLLIVLYFLCNLSVFNSSYELFRLFLVFSAFFTLILLILFRPRFLNHLSLEFTLLNTSAKSDTIVDKTVFMDCFFGKSYYLNPLASLEDMAIELGVSTTDLYNFIYHNYTLSFNDLLNKHRVDYFIDLVQSRKYPHYTIDALAQLSGFSSRHHLYKPFQKFHGGTPSGFMNSIS